MRLRPAGYWIFALLMFAGFCCSAGEKEKSRHSEENAKYSLKVIRDKLILVRKSDHRTGEINGLPYGSDRMAYNYLPERMLSPDGNIVVFPIQGSAYLMVDLEEYFEEKCKLGECNSCRRIVGGGAGEGELRVARGVDNFRVGGVLSDNLIEGYVDSYGDGERGAKWYLKLEEERAIIGNKYFENLLTLRGESYAQNRERSFLIILDAKEFERLEAISEKIKKEAATRH